MLKREVKVDKIRKNFYITLVILIAVLATTYIYTHSTLFERYERETTEKKKGMWSEWQD